MKNKPFFYQQYNKIDWKNQEKTRINEKLNKYIIDTVLSKYPNKTISLYDIGFGIGFFFRMIYEKLDDKFKNILLEGCEPSIKNYTHFKQSNLQKSKQLKVEQEVFLKIKTDTRFDFVTAIYVFPHFTSDDIEDIAKKIHFLLKTGGKFILVVANEKYINNKLKEERDLFIETNTIYLGDKTYKEFLHYSDIPEIGKLIDYNREEEFYSDLFNQNGFRLDKKESIEDAGFIATMFIFEKVSQ